VSPFALTLVVQSVVVGVRVGDGHVTDGKSLITRCEVPAESFVAIGRRDRLYQWAVAFKSTTLHQFEYWSS
jgi:hypothetical protein